MTFRGEVEKAESDIPVFGTFPDAKEPCPMSIAYMTIPTLFQIEFSGHTPQLKIEF